MKPQVWLIKRRTGCCKVCPACSSKNTATAKDCGKCGVSLEDAKRSFIGKKASYTLRWADPRTGKTKSEAVGPDKAYAQHRVAKLKQEILSGEYRGITTITFDAFVTEHLASIQDTLSKASYIEHQRVLEQFKQACHPKDLTVIDFQMLERFRAARLGDACSAATVNKGLRTLQAALQRAVDRGYLRSNPFKGKRQKLFVKEAEPVPVVLEPVDFVKLLSICPDGDWRAVCTVGYYGGLRLGEILALEWGDVDFPSRMLHVRNKADHRTKSGKNRAVPMSVEVVDALEALAPAMFTSKQVLPGLQGPHAIANASRTFRQLVAAAGLTDEQGRPRFSMHDLRRTFVTNLLATGTDPKSVQALAGHADVQTTLKHYAAVRAKNLTAAVDRLSQLSAHTA